MLVFLFKPASVPLLVLGVLVLVMLGYLSSVRGKGIATRWFMAAFAGLGVTIAVIFLNVSWYPRAPAVTPGLVLMASVGLFYGGYLQFAFHYLELKHPREARVALVIWMVFLVLSLAASAFFNSAILGPIYAVTVHCFLVWGMVVFLRKWRKSAQEASSGGGSEKKRAYRALALVSVLLVVGTVAWFAFFATDPDGSLLQGAEPWVVVSFAVVLVYLNYAPEPTSFQVKLVGLPLVAVLGLLTVLVYAVQDYGMEGVDLQDRRAVRFTPDTTGVGGYEANAWLFTYEDDLGQDLHLGDDSTTAVALGFSFPFYGATWDSLHISPNGAVTFGEPIYRTGTAIYSSAYYYNTVPKIAPFYTDLNPTAGGGVFYKQGSDRVMVTWHETPRHQTTHRYSVQLVLHKAGMIDISYKEMEKGMTFGVRGMTPGDVSVSRTDGALSRSLTEDLPYIIAAKEARTEDFGLISRNRTHKAISPLIWLVLGATAFVLLVFPFVYRSSLIRPLAQVLEGVQRVNAGDLTTTIPVGTRDEIGRLTRQFNGMTESLAQYHGEMEALVAERTQQLEDSVETLRATQAQLIQQEKMASLGALTAGIAHEIKNPLNFINNFAEVNEDLADEALAAMEAHDAEEVRALLADMKQNAAVINQHGQRADGIVRAMMQHASGGAGQREVVEVNALVEEHLNLAWHGKRATWPGFTVDLQRDYGADAGTAEVVPQEMGRVLLNLIGNAFDAVHEKSSAAGNAYTPAVQVSTRLLDAGVQIRVRDNGPGVAAALQEKIFEPFFTTKPTGSGTGLGLSLSYDIVTQGHGGTLHVESQEGGGATFVITLPRNGQTVSS